MKIFTWNVLHRYHEEKYNPQSDVLSKYPNENHRIVKQIDTLKNIFDKENEIIGCLQEVSGDLLNAIKKEFTIDFIIFEFEHNRIPTRQNKSSIKSDPYIKPNEFLVTIISKNLDYKKFSNIQLEVKGKGILVVETSNIIILNVHLPPKRLLKNSVDQIFRNLLYVKNKFIVVLGDFNRNYYDLHEELLNIHIKENQFNQVKTNNKFTISKNQTSIDHIIGLNNLSFKDSEVLNVDSSDHNLLISESK